MNTKNILIQVGLLVGIVAVTAGVAQAQMMGGFVADDDHTAREEAEGKIIWEALRDKTKACADLADDDFEALGEYFMGQMMGDSHTAMNAMMERMLGEAGEGHMHLIMGKRLSGCDPNAVFPLVARGFMPMMQMMWGGWASPSGGGANSMMNWGWGPLAWLGGIAVVLWVLWWAFVIVVVVMVARWLIRRIRGKGSHGALGILKERYARGEISKQEFEEKKRDLS